MRKDMMAILIATLTLQACAFGGTQTPTSNLAPEPKKKPAASLLAACPELPQPKDGKKTNLLSNHVQVAKLYHKCRENHQGLANWHKETQ